jgi:hypothetical protein
MAHPYHHALSRSEHSSSINVRSAVNLNTALLDQERAACSPRKAPMQER